MGRIQPLPGCYILTLLDLVTRYSKVVLLNGPNSEKVMEALICISCITGVLKEMLTIKINNWTKNGWQKQINFYTAFWRLQSERTGRYVSLLEYFNGTFKQILRRWCSNWSKTFVQLYCRSRYISWGLNSIIFVGSIFQRNLIQDEFLI